MARGRRPAPQRMRLPAAGTRMARVVAHATALDEEVILVRSWSKGGDEHHVLVGCQDDEWRVWTLRGMSAALHDQTHYTGTDPLVAVNVASDCIVQAIGQGYAPVEEPAHVTVKDVDTTQRGLRLQRLMTWPAGDVRAPENARISETAVWETIPPGAQVHYGWERRTRQGQWTWAGEGDAVQVDADWAGTLLRPVSWVQARDGTSLARASGVERMVAPVIVQPVTLLGSCQWDERPAERAGKAFGHALTQTEYLIGPSADGPWERLPYGLGGATPSWAGHYLAVRISAVNDGGETSLVGPAYGPLIGPDPGPRPQSIRRQLFGA